MSIKELPMDRFLLEGQRTSVNIGFIDGSPAQEIFSTTEILLEAPNWHPRTNTLLLNGNGKLWTLPASGGSLTQLEISGLPAVNNDHVLSLDAESVYASTNDFHIYQAKLDGSQPARKITEADTHIANHLMHFLHGVSPDDQTLAFVGLGWDVGPDFNTPPSVNEIFTVPTSGGPATQLTKTNGGIDGSEYSPDGNWIYVNSEHFSGAQGNAQICRMPSKGGPLEQLTFDENVNWFPHFAPVGEHAVYLAFPPGTKGHPANLDVSIKVVQSDWTRPVAEYNFFGGQGTINVNSWSPDGQSFAFVSYPMN
jgi:Tol biopolymer transport system component